MYVSFSRIASGLCIYHLFAWSTLNLLHNSYWITMPTQSCIVIYSFCASLFHSLIMWLNVSSLSLYNLYVLFCCVIIIVIISHCELRVFHTHVSWWYFTGVWVTASFPNSCFLSIMADFNNGLVWIVSARPISISSCPLTKPLRTVPCAPIPFAITVTSTFYMFSSLERSKYLSIFYLFSLGITGAAEFLFLLINIKCDLLAGIR